MLSDGSSAVNSAQVLVSSVHSAFSAGIDKDMNLDILSSQFFKPLTTPWKLPFWKRELS